MSAPDELVVARLFYEATPTFSVLRTRLYLLESALYYDFYFVSQAGKTVWYWLVSNPSDPAPYARITQAFGPYRTSAQVPAPTFLADAGFAYTGTWNVVNQSCDGYAGGGTNDAMTAGTWFSFLTGTGTLSRIMNVDHTNDFHIPVLGAYYLVNFPTFETLTSAPALDIAAVESSAIGNAGAAGPSLMLTQQDIQTTMVNPPAGASLQHCSAQDIAAIIPGLSAPQTQPAPPAWTNQMQTTCYMIGQDTYPYYSQVFYDYTGGQSQTSIFVTTDATMGATPYNARQDMILPLGTVGPALNYQWGEFAPRWGTVCYTPGGGVVPMSVPNFVQAGGGRCRALIENNPYFGQDDTISIWSVMLGGASGWSDFWYWFNAEQQGIVFSLAPAASLTMIDYRTFIQNPSFAPGTFNEPTDNLPRCGTAASDKLQKAMFIPKGGY